jgi:hypothetical protein
MAAGAVVGMSLSGCDLGLVDPPQEASAVAVRLHMDADAVARTIAWTVEIAPGRGPSGDRVPSDPRLWVNGDAFHPTVNSGDLTYSFSETLSVPPGVLNVRPPVFPDVATSPDSILAPVLAVEAPDTITVGASESITLHLYGTADTQHPAVGAPDLAVHRSSARWRATFVPDSASTAAGASTITIDTQGSLTSSVELPAILLGPGFSAGRLSFQVWAVTDLQSDDGVYRVSIERTAVEAVEVLIQT